MITMFTDKLNSVLVSVVRARPAETNTEGKGFNRLSLIYKSCLKFLDTSLNISSTFITINLRNKTIIFKVEFDASLAPPYTLPNALRRL